MRKVTIFKGGYTKLNSSAIHISTHLLIGGPSHQNSCRAPLLEIRSVLTVFTHFVKPLKNICKAYFTFICITDDVAKFIFCIKKS